MENNWDKIKISERREENQVKIFFNPTNISAAVA